MAASQALIDSYTQLHVLFYWVVFILSYGESMAFIGIFIPGSITLILSGYLAARGFFDFGDLFIFATLGAIAGDTTSYYMGRSNAISVKAGKWLFNEKRIEQGKAFFERYGSKSVFWGRFIGFVRPMVPFVAGMFGMKERKFFLYNVFSGIAWALSHLVVGFFFYHSYLAVKDWLVSLF